MFLEAEYRQNILSERTSRQKAHVVKAWAVRACFTKGLLGTDKHRTVPPFCDENLYMKRFALLLVAVLFVFVQFPALASIKHVLIDGIYYNLDVGFNTATVTYHDISSYDSNSMAYTGDVVIPSEIEYNHVSYKVTSIGEYAFQRCKGLKTIVFPTTLKDIGKYAFQNCEGLSSVSIPNGVETIGEYNQEIKGKTNVEIISVIA